MRNLEHFPRWIMASIASWVDENREGVLLYVEGQDRAKLQGKEDYFELRVDGPNMVQQTQTQADFYVEVNMLINAHKDGKDAYKLQRLLGICMKALAVCIPVYRLGDGPLDGPKQEPYKVGELQRQETPKNTFDVAGFGQIEPTQTNEQGTVAAPYALYYCED